jgi:hypothetical protein
VKEGVTSAVIDSEAVAWDRENKVIQPFQVIHSLLFILFELAAFRIPYTSSPHTLHHTFLLTLKSHP